MSFSLGDSGELSALAQAIGLLDAAGDLDLSWFNNPLIKLQGVVRDAGQRAALGRFCDLALPPVSQPGRPQTEKWHPLLGDLPAGNLYLTLNDTGGSLLVGVGGEYHSGAGAPVGGRLLVQADLISGGSTLGLVIGTSQHPIVAEARVETGWSYDPAAGHPIGLGAIVGRATIVPDPGNPSFGLTVLLENLSLAGESPVDKALDVDELGQEAPDLLAALLKVVLADVGTDPTLTMIADHLLGLFGLAEADAIPDFPFAELAAGPAALQSWLAELIGSTGGVPTATAWLQHLAGLLGQSVAATGTGTMVDPWRVRLLELAGIGELAATAGYGGSAGADARLRIGLAVSIGASLGAGEPTISAEAVCALADVPLAGLGHASVLPDAAVRLRLTGTGGPLVTDATVDIGSAEAGISWDGSVLRPLLRLLDNHFAGTPYPVLDLTDVGSVEAAATSVVVNALTAALGTGVGRRLAAIVGLVPPEDPADPGNPIAGWTHQLNLPQLVSDPVAAIEGYHRAVLADVDRWSLILREIVHLIGIETVLDGSGSAADPWRATLAGTGGPELQLAAWHQPDPTTPSTDQLRIGLRLAAVPTAATLALSSEVLCIDLPASGAATVSLIGAQRLSLVLAPALEAADGPIGLTLDSLSLGAGWQPGGPLGWEIHANGLTISADGDAMTVTDLHLPPTGPFDLTDLPGTAAAIGLSVTQLEDLVRLMICALTDLAGPEAQLATALLGLGHRLPGLDAGLPSLVDPTQPGLLFTDPLGALRSWLARLLNHVGADGQAALPLLLDYLAALGTEEFDDVVGGISAELLEPTLSPALVGGGTFADPWRVPWPGADADSGPDLELWLEPAGPPISWVAGLQTRTEDATGLDDLAEVLVQTGQFDPSIRSLVKGLTARDVSSRLHALQVQLNAGDGVVGADAQAPDIFGWVTGARVDAAHAELPQHPDVITDVLSRIETLHGAGPRTVLLIGPAFTDHTVWTDLLGSPARQGTTEPGAHFDLRTPGIDPRTIALDPVTAVADYYTADLADDRSGDVGYLTAQIAHVADRISVLHPGPVIIVAHSYTALPARRYAADHPGAVQGLITIGAPHLGTPLNFLTDLETGDAIRLAASLRPGLPASPLRDAIDQLQLALEGYRPPTGPGALATPDPYPASSFALAAPYDLGEVPVITIAGVLTDDVFGFLQTGLGGYLGQLAGTDRPVPTHIGYGMAMPVPVGPGGSGTADLGTPQAQGRVRFGLGQIPLGSSPAPPPHPAQLLRVEVDLVSGTGWLVGEPGQSTSASTDARLRRAQLGLTAAPSGSGAGSGIQAIVDATLDQAAWHGVTSAQLTLADPIAAALIGAGFGSVLAGTDTGDAPLSNLAAALSGIGLLSTDAEAVTGLSGDGFAALRADPVGYLSARVPTALARDGGWAGMITDPSVSTLTVQEAAYLWAPPGSPYALFARREADGSWRTGIETSTALGATEPPILSLGADVDLQVPAFRPTVEVTATMGPVRLTYRTQDGTISLDAPPYLSRLVLWPTPSIADLAGQLESTLPQVLVSGVLGGVLGRFAPGLRITGLQQLLAAPGAFLADLSALGHPDGGFDPAKLGSLLATLNSALGLPAGPGLQLPGDLSITAGAGTIAGSSRIAVSTGTAIGGVLDVDLSLDIDAGVHVSPGGTVTLATPLTGSWPQVSITFGVEPGAGPAGFSLVISPQGVAPITLLPTFSGLGALRGAAEGLLPRVLDAAVDTHPDPKPDWLAHLLAAAGHLDLYDPVGKFTAHTAGFTAMLEGTWFDSIDQAEQTGMAAAVVDLLTLIPGRPGTLDSVGGLVRWTYALPADQGSVQIAAGWGSNGPTAQLGLLQLKPTAAPMALGAQVRVDDTGLLVTSSVGVDLGSLGITVSPRIVADLDTGGAFRVRFLPLGTDSADGPLVVQLGPSFAVTAAADTAQTILVGLALPLAVEVAISALHDALARPVWSGGPTLTDALTAAGILTGGGQVAHPLPNPFQMLTGFLVEAAELLDLTVGDLQIRLVSPSGRIGLALTGKQAIPLGELELDLRFGAPTAWGSAAAEGLQLLLLDVSGPQPDFDFGLRLHGVGVGLAKSDGTPLVAESYLRLGSVQALLFLDLETGSGLQVLHGGAGLSLGSFGLPIGAALGAGAGGNPVASNLLSSGGSGGGSADGQAVNPSSDVDVWYWDDPANAGGPFRVLIGGQTGLFWIPIHAAFGPIYIGELGLGVSNTAATLAIDGGVSIAGLSAEVDGLSFTIPYAHVGDPSQWSVDLKGLAVGYSGPAISIAGGLVKYDGPPIEYDGMLLIKIGTIGAVVIGAYSVVGDGADQYTSFAIFGGVFVPIGLTPLINLTGIALGLGYNRRLVVPEDLNKIPDFMLVKALDRPEALANNPMQALFEFRQQTPAARGALWLAAGLRGTSFELVNITAVLYVAIDNGVDVGIIGVARMALPTDDAAIVSIELALKARFSSAEGLFSVQAQLTDNSWLITRDCQLTGGFAFFWWFQESQFLLTIGGYHPSFTPRPEYPVVPRLGFRWDFLGVVHIKGESYFALTNTAVMTGVRMEATYGPDWLQVWFTAYTDILVSRDPFHYIVDIGIGVGARLRIRICFFACCTIEISVSVGAALHLEGPPFHGTVTADLGVTSITVPFGDDALPPPPPKHWDEFVSAYIQSGDANSSPVGAQVSAGLLPAEPAGAPVAPGTAEQPWRISAEWALRTESRMPARGLALQLDTPVAENDLGSVVFGRVDDLSSTYEFDIAPMYVAHGSLTAVHRVVIAVRPENATDFVDLIPRSQNPADPTLEIDEGLFTVRPTIGQVSEATYHYFPDLKPPAAANTLPALTGLEIAGVAGLHNQSATIPIGTLVDATNYRPLPFARRTQLIVTGVLQAGAAWLEIAQVGDGVPTSTLLGGFSTIVGGSDTFADLRSESGLRPGGYGPVARQALTTRRSAPPVLSALSEGYTLQDPGIGTAPAMPKVGQVNPVFLEQPRLRTMAQRATIPAGLPTLVHTTAPAQPQARAGDLPVVDVRNDLVTSFQAPGFALIVAHPTTAPQPTRAARSTRTLRNAALGGAVGQAAATALDDAADLALGDGITVRAGCTQLWEVPRNSGWRLLLAGDSAVRVTQLSTAGTVLTDTVTGAADAEWSEPPDQIVLAAGCGMVAVTALGRPDPAYTKTTAGRRAQGTSRRGAVTGAVAADGGVPVVGWQLGSEVVQVGPTTLLGRGAVIALTAAAGAPIRGHLAAAGMIPISRALLDQQVVQTDFGPDVTVIGVLVENPSGLPVGPESVIVAVDTPVKDGATVAAEPTRIVAGRRTLFLYDLVLGDAIGRRAPAGRIAVTAGLVNTAGTQPSALAGVLAARGSAADWAAALNGSTLTQLVGAEQLTVDGSVKVRFDHG